ncbi:cytochrome P450 [Streptomyces sp. URMC 123]|uniref:cytochrome P450 n=1 Tax=Streptomyces sp. URMC 123 TaxID=3423403 RepID=UPI003F1B46A8
MNGGEAPALAVGRDFWDQLPFDVRGDAYRADPYPFFDQLRSGGPVRRLSDAVLVVTGHRECLAVLGDERFGLGAVPMESRSFLMVDPPEHRRLRVRVAAPFAVRAVERLRPAIRQRADALLRGAALRGELDVVAELGVPLALEVICALVGVPLGERAAWRETLSALTAGFDPASLRDPGTSERVECARLDFARYLGALIQERREEPADDLVSALTAPGHDGRVLTTDQVITAVGQLIVAGYEPMVNMLANGLYALLRHPSALDSLAARPETAPAVVEELLRYDPPIQLLTRVASRDADIGGVAVPRGTMVGLLVGAANRDPAVFDRPHELDVTRSPEHLALGWGEHFCLGARLVRVQAEVTLTALARARPVLTDEPVRYRSTMISRGVERLPVVLTAQPDDEGHWA